MDSNAYLHSYVFAKTRPLETAPNQCMVIFSRKDIGDTRITIIFGIHISPLRYGLGVRVLRLFNNIGYTMLKSKVDNRLTDKDTYHSYLDTYETLFARLRDTASNVLEIGIWDGGSISLWSEYFLRATIHAFDITF